jgi:protein-S-isoprenylcysteine O-methyltransferase Ste14
MGGVFFAASLVLCTFWYLVPLGRTRPASRWPALAIDIGLFAVFALHHSAFARDRVKQRIARAIPDRLLRPIYVWIASGLLTLVCLLWRPVGGTVYRVGAPMSAALILLELTGVWLITRSVRAIDALELAGIRSVATAPTRATLQIKGPYGLVRHPLYLGWIAAVCGHPHMTGDRFAFALLSSAYLLIAIPWEERSLEQTFGGAYEQYRRRVRWRVIPFLY